LWDERSLAGLQKFMKKKMKKANALDFGTLLFKTL